MQGWAEARRLTGGFHKAWEGRRGSLRPGEAWAKQAALHRWGPEQAFPSLPDTWEPPTCTASLIPGGPPPPFPPHLALALCWATATSVGIRKRMSVSKSTTVFFLVSWDESWAQGSV